MAEFQRRSKRGCLENAEAVKTWVSGKCVRGCLENAWEKMRGCLENAVKALSVKGLHNLMAEFRGRSKLGCLENARENACLENAGKFVDLAPIAEDQGSA